jgi:hypothetical protein
LALSQHDFSAAMAMLANIAIAQAMAVMDFIVFCLLQPATQPAVLLCLRPWNVQSDSALTPWSSITGGL